MIPCPECGRLTAAETQACTNCGHSLANGTQAKSPAEKLPPPPEVSGWVVHKTPPEMIEEMRRTFIVEEFLAELREVERELSFSKVGRKARLAGTVEAMDFGGGLAPVVAPALPSALVFKPDTLGKVRKLCPGYDIYALENEWRMWAARKPAPGNADAAFIAFAKTYVKNHPL